MIPGFLESLWGYCTGCEHWHCSDRWHIGEGGPACPHCGEPAAVVERIDGDRGMMRLDLEVATGPVGNRRFFD